MQPTSKIKSQCAFKKTYIVIENVVNKLFEGDPLTFQ